jgi:uncharacterized glyoxalase superfamily protein PhnB
VKRAPVLDQLNLVASDFDASVAFYRRLGLDMPNLSAQAGVRHAEIALANGFGLALDDEPLARVYNAAWRTPNQASRALIGFRLESREAVNAKYAELVAAGYAGRQVPYDAFWGARYAVVADPDGNDVGLMSPPDDAKRSWPPAKSPEA